MNSKLRNILLSSMMGLVITMSPSSPNKIPASDKPPQPIKEKIDYKEEIKNLRQKYPFLTRPGIDAALNYTLPAAKFNNIKPLEIIDKTISITGKGYSHSALKHAVPAALNKRLNKKQTLSSLEQLMNVTNNKPNFVFKFGYEPALEQYKKDNEKLEETIKGLGITSKYLGNSLIFLSEDMDKLDYSEISDKESFVKQYTLMLNNITENTSKESLKGMAHCMNEAHQIEAELHNGKDEIRKHIGKNTDFDTKYYLISGANKDLFTTSFYHLYENFPENYIDSIKNIDSDKTYWGDYVLQMGSMNKAKEILEKDSLFFLNSIKKSLESSENEDALKTLERGVYLTNPLLEFYKNPEYNKLQKNLEEFLLNRYKNHKSTSEKAVFGYFIKHNKEPLTKETKQLRDSLPEIPSPKIPGKFLDKDTLSMKSYYYGDDWYNFSINQYTSSPYNMEIKEKDEKNAVLEKKLSNNKVLKFHLTKDISDVIKTLREGEYDVVAHRSHSYDLDNTFPSSVENAKSILYLGSCNSFRDSPEIQEKYPSSFLISEKGTGEGKVNNKVSYEIMERLAKGAKKWEDIKSDYAEKEGIVFPHEENQLILRYLERIKNMK